MASIGTIVMRKDESSNSGGLAAVAVAAPLAGTGEAVTPVSLSIDGTSNGGDNLLQVTAVGLYVDPAAVATALQGELVQDAFGVDLGYLLPL